MMVVGRLCSGSRRMAISSNYGASGSWQLVAIPNTPSNSRIYLAAMSGNGKYMMAVYNYIVDSVYYYGFHISTDNGLNWSDVQLFSPNTVAIDSIAISNDGNLWTIGRGDSILYSTNFGVSWYNFYTDGTYAPQYAHWNSLNV
jgi:hypothetical protein